MVQRGFTPVLRRLQTMAVIGMVTVLAGAAPTVAAPCVVKQIAKHTGTATAKHGERAAGGRSAGAGTPHKVCGTRSLRGPAKRPSGAVRVRPSQHLPSLVERSAPRTTFWLTRGVHTFGDGPYDQVRPKDGDRFIGAPGAVIDGRGVNRYAFVGYARGVRISSLTIQNFGAGIGDNGGEGVVNHDSGDNWYIDHNTIRGNAGAGLFLGNGGKAIKNCLLRNGEYGFQSFETDGARNVVLRGNEIARNNTGDWENTHPGCGCSGGGKFWNTRNARVVGNYVHHNRGPGLWADTNDVGFLFKGNYISDNESEGIFYEISYNAAIKQNTFARNGWKVGFERGSGFPIAAIYLSEAGSDRRAGARYGRTLEISGNRFVDNWAGVMAWENPDRFAGSPVNTSTGFTTLVNPRVATVANCGSPELIGRRPYVDDCRWKTQHLRVQRNSFVLRPARIPGCTVARGCGFNGLVANVGTVPDWSPYQGYVVPDNISRHQDNVWRSNTYQGPWRFMVRLLGPAVTWSTWTSAPFHQDKGSTRR